MRELPFRAKHPTRIRNVISRVKLFAISVRIFLQICLRGKLFITLHSCSLSLSNNPLLLPIADTL